MTNFGILMEIKGIDNPFEWSRDVVKKCQAMYKADGNHNYPYPHDELSWQFKDKVALYYSPSRTTSLTSEGNKIECHQIDSLDIFKEAMGEYADYILNFIDQMNKVFEFGDDWGMYIPEVKYLSPEPLVDYKNLALHDYPNVHFVGDALSARGITVSGAQGIYVAEYLL